MKTFISQIKKDDVYLPKEPAGADTAFMQASDILENALRVYKKAPVFKLPNNGVLISSKKFTVRRFCLPYRHMVLEFQEGFEKGDLCDILMLSQTGPGEAIQMLYITRTIGASWLFAPILATFVLKEDEVEIVVEGNPTVPMEDGRIVGYYRPKNLGGQKVGLYQFKGSEVYVGRMNWVFTSVLQMMMLLACKNVTVRDSTPRLKKGCKLKERIGTHYKELVIEVKNKISSSNAEAPDETDIVERYRPGEHIRMGHDHRFKTKDGYVTYWIQDTIVNAGVGYKVEKTYRLRPSD
jgi:hypothetical protein